MIDEEVCFCEPESLGYHFLRGVFTWLSVVKYGRGTAELFFYQRHGELSKLLPLFGEREVALMISVASSMKLFSSLLAE